MPKNLTYKEFLKLPSGEIDLDNPVHNRFWLMWIDGLYVDDDGKIKKSNRNNYKQSSDNFKKMYQKNSLEEI